MVTKQVKISELPDAGELTGDELFEVVQGGLNKKVPARNLFLAGPEGKSAYDVAVEEGFTGTKFEWLTTLVGQPGLAGKSAYRSAQDNGFVGTEAQWVTSLKGADGINGTDGRDGTNGRDGRSAYEVAVSRGYVGSEVQWLASLKGADGADGQDGDNGADGKSAYQLAVESGFAGTYSEWVASLKGETGSPGTGFIFATFPGAIGPLDAKPRWSPPKPIVLKNVTLNIDTAPTVEVVFDIKKNGVSIFSNNHPKLAVGQNKSDTVVADVAVTADDYLTLDILVGNGSDLTARIDYV